MHVEEIYLEKGEILEEKVKWITDGRKGWECLGEFPLPPNCDRRFYEKRFYVLLNPDYSKLQKKKMKLGEFIEEMKKGWGFRRPQRVRRIGYALENIVPLEDRNIEVEVIYVPSSYGMGPNFHYTYDWFIKGYDFSTSSSPKKLQVTTESDFIFGFSSLPEIEIGKGVFRVGYEW